MGSVRHIVYSDIIIGWPTSRLGYYMTNYLILIIVLITNPVFFSIYWDLFQPLIREGKVLLFSPEDETKPASWIFGLRLVDNKRNIEELNVYFNQKQIEIRLFYPINSHLHISKQFEAEAQVLTNYTARLL